MDAIDFRSDTVTWPTLQMRQAMSDAPVGDDVYGEDPSVNRLEQLAASKLGMEDSLFVASGTMGNLVAVMSHTDHGNLAIVGADGHIFTSEAGGLSALGGVIPFPLPTDFEGKMDLAEIEGSIWPEDPHYARAKLILLENTFGAKSGAPQPLSYMKAVRDIAEDHGLYVHLDGARLFNAATALGVGADEIAQHADSVSFCLSKGLCAPVGSMLCGTKAFIYEARRKRKVLGGGMRQAGILAAAGIVAIEKMIDRLSEDHTTAKLLARGLAELPAIQIDVDAIRTNILFFELDEAFNGTAQSVADRLQHEFNIKIGVAGERRFRALTHYWVGQAEVERLLSAMNQLLRSRFTSSPQTI